MLANPLGGICVVGKKTVFNPFFFVAERNAFIRLCFFSCRDAMKVPKNIVRSAAFAVLAMLFVFALAVWLEWPLQWHLWISLAVGIVVYGVSLWLLDFRGKTRQAVI